MTSSGPRRSISFADPAAPARPFVVLATGESLVLSARVSPGESLVVRVRAREIARSRPVEAATSSRDDVRTVAASVLVPHDALRVAPFAVLRVDLCAVDLAGRDRVIESIALVEPRGLRVASIAAALAVLAPASLALLALVASRSITARSLIVQLVESALVALALAPALRRWSGRLRFVARFDARVALGCALGAWTLFFAARAQNLVVHNLTGRPQSAGRIAVGRTTWLRAQYASLEGASRPCASDGPVCLLDDPRSVVPAACADVPEEEPLVRLHHAVRFLGCPSRFEVFDRAWLRDASVCQAPARGGQCCVDLRGDGCDPPRRFEVETPWPAGSAPRARDPQCPTRELLPWRVRATVSTGAAAVLRAIREANVAAELCVDLERWGSAHEIIIEHEGRTWRAARAPDARARAMRVAIPRLERPERATVRLAYTVRESDESRAIESAHESRGAPSGLWLPTQLRFESQPVDGARAALSSVSIGPRARDALASAQLVVRAGQPALNAELWPGLACGSSVTIVDPAGQSQGEATLPCAEPGRRSRDDEPWVLWRFALREEMPVAWREGARVLTDQLGAGAVRFRSERVAPEVFLAFRGWDGVSIDLRMYSREPRTFGIEPVGEVMRGHVAGWRVFAGPPPPREGLCCQLDGVWSTCPAEFNDYWRCQGTVAGRPGCAESYRRCTFIDWAVERAARRAEGARSTP